MSIFRLRLLHHLPSLLIVLGLGLLAGVAAAAPALTRISRDPYTNSTSQHLTQVEPDTFAYGSTIVAAFQTGRFFDGGASNIGWATSTDGGTSWQHGFLRKTTTFVGGQYARVSDPSVSYDPKHDVWLINALSLGGNGQGVIVSRSTDGGLSWHHPVLVAPPQSGYDKNWIVCDTWQASPAFGNCYVEWDDASLGGLIYLSTSTDGGVTWSAPAASLDNAQGLGGQPLVQPNGSVVVAFVNSAGNQMRAFRSTDGGTSWGKSKLIAAVSDHLVAGNLRTFALPSAEVDGGGKIYLVWQDCRFIQDCRANDLVMSTSTDGEVWSRVRRIPLDPRTSGIDHFIPGIAADPNTSGATARLALAYYYYPNTDCSDSTCRLNVGITTSTDGGKTWSPATRLAGGMRLTWLASTTLGYMVGDYISTSIVNGNAVPVFAVAREKKATFRESMFAPSSGLPILGGTLTSANDEPLPNAQSDHPPRLIQRIP